MLEEYHHLVSEYTSLLKVLEAQGITPQSSAEMVPGHTLSSTHIHTHSQEGTTSAVSVKSDISTGKSLAYLYSGNGVQYYWHPSLLT